MGDFIGLEYEDYSLTNVDYEVNCVNIMKGIIWFDDRWVDERIGRDWKRLTRIGRN